MHGHTHSLQYLHSYLDYLQKLARILTLFIIFCVQYDEFHHLLYTKAYTTWITYNVVFTYLQYNTITYDTNNTNAYMITHVAYVDSVVLSIKILL